jgi:hypothetical protein
MICSSCGTQTSADERFCRNCGQEVVPLAKTMVAPPPNVYTPSGNLTDPQPVNPQAQTSPMWSPAPTTPYVPANAAKQRPSPYRMPLIIVSALVLVTALSVLGYYLFSKNGPDDETGGSTGLPDHFGIFIQNNDYLKELRARDFTDALAARDSLINESLPQASAQPTLIIFADPQYITIPDLKLVQLDSMSANGQARYWNYQIAPVEGQSNMKRIRVDGGLASGKYAFVLFNGFLDQGNHKFWPFEVGAGAPAPTVSPETGKLPPRATASATPSPGITTKRPTPMASPKPSTDEKIAYCNMNYVNMRKAPALDAAVVTVLTSGQKLRVLRTSSNYSTAYIPSLKKDVTDNWTEVQLYDDSSTHGWVFSYFISYR